MMKKSRLGAKICQPTLLVLSSGRCGSFSPFSWKDRLRVAARIIAVALLWVSLLSGQTIEGRSSELQEKEITTQQEQAQARVQAEAQPEKLVAGPQNIKEKTAIYVFLAWLWLSIGILVYILRLKIKEADRLHAIKFLNPDRK